MPLFYGEYNEVGEIVQDTNKCILTGKAVQAGDMVAAIPKTRYFVRVSARESAQVTPEMLEAVGRAIAAEKVQTAAISPAPVPEKKIKGGETPADKDKEG